MTTKEKAIELLWKYLPILEGWKFEDSNLAKQCALIAVDELIQAIRFTDAKSDLGYVGYWQKVKQEINKL